VSLDLAPVAAQIGPIAHGFALTAGIWALALAVSLVLGLSLALLRHHAGLLVTTPVRAVVEIVRGTPFLIQLFLLYFGGPYAGLSLDAIPAGLLGLSVYGGAYFSELFRAGFEAVPRGHVEAAECAGFSRAQIVRRILLPEMTMLVLPSAINLAISLLKDTAVLSVITVPELTLTISALGTEFYAFVESLFLLALSYWGLTEISAWLGRIAERKLSRFRFAIP